MGAGAAVNVFKCVWWWMVAVFRAVGVHRNPIGKFLLCLINGSFPSETPPARPGSGMIA